MTTTTEENLQKIIKKYDVKYFDGLTYMVSEEFEKDLNDLPQSKHRRDY